MTFTTFLSLEFWLYDCNIYQASSPAAAVMKFKWRFGGGKKTLKIAKYFLKSKSLREDSLFLEGWNVFRFLCSFHKAS